MTNRRIVMIGPSIDALGGMASVLATYRDAGLFARWPVTLLATYVEGSVLTRLSASLRAYVLFLGMLARKRVGLVHLHSAQETSFLRKSIFLFTARLFGCPTLFHLHGAAFDSFYTQSNSLYQAYIRKTLNSSTCVITLSGFWKDWVRGITNHPHILNIYNPVIFRHHAGSTSQRATPPVLLFMGRLGQRKGTYDLVRAAAQLRQWKVDCSLVLCGDGDNDATARLVEELDLLNVVTLKGWVAGEEKYHLYSMATVFVLPSYNEGLPIAILEAMAAGLPIVSTPVGGIPEAITDESEGLLVPPGDVPRLASALRRLVEDPDLAMRLGSAGRAKVAAAFEAARALEPLNKLYGSFAAERGISETLPAREESSLGHGAR